MTSIDKNFIPIKPFLRWAGGKNWLVKHINSLVPTDGFNNYYEPFLGGGSIFLSLKTNGKVFLSDLNEDLINTYSCIKNNIHEVISHLKQFDNTEQFYYKIRNCKTVNAVERAAIFIFLNQTSFNGIYRVNLKGEYNVPYGHRSKSFLEEEKLMAISTHLGNAHLSVGDFENIKANIEKHDLIFLDPPYTVSHNLNGFIKYNQNLFSLEDQYRLSSLIDFIKSKEAYYILTNAAHKKIIEIFDKNDQRVELNRACVIGGRNAKRGATSEYIFTNCNSIRIAQ